MPRLQRLLFDQHDEHNNPKFTLGSWAKAEWDIHLDDGDIHHKGDIILVTHDNIDYFNDPDYREKYSRAAHTNPDNK
jgi:hypothetical protein